MKFLGNVLATIVGLFVFTMICFFGIVLIGVLFSSSEDSVTIKDNSVIELDLSQIQYDYAGKVNFKDFDFLIKVNLQIIRNFIIFNVNHLINYINLLLISILKFDFFILCHDKVPNNYFATLCNFLLYLT